MASAGGFFQTKSPAELQSSVFYRPQSLAVSGWDFLLTQNRNVVFCAAPSFFWASRLCVDKATKVFPFFFSFLALRSCVDYTVNHSPSSLSHPLMLIFHIPAVNPASWPKKGLGEGRGGEGAGRELSLSPHTEYCRWQVSVLVPARVFKKKLDAFDRRRVHPSRSDSLMNVSASLIRVYILNIAFPLFDDDVITPVRDSVWLFARFDKATWWNVVSRPSTVGNRRSHKTDQRSQPSVYDWTLISAESEKAAGALELPAPRLSLIQHSWPTVASDRQAAGPRLVKHVIISFFALVFFHQ